MDMHSEEFEPMLTPQKSRPHTAPMIELALVFAMISLASFFAFVSLG
jgi:hypothetical protein